MNAVLPIRPRTLSSKQQPWRALLLLYSSTCLYKFASESCQAWGSGGAYFTNTSLSGITVFGMNLPGQK
jgi:hypothetical protein